MSTSQKCKLKKISIDIYDIVICGNNGRVIDALKSYCEDSSDVSCGVVGPAFTTSGPGSGYSIQHDVTDFARRAMEGGALYYLDTDDGRLAYAPDWTDDLYNGQEIKWSDKSVVILECPSVEDTIEHPEITAEMAETVIRYKSSNANEWLQLISSIQDVAEKISRINVDELSEIANNETQ